MQQRDGLLQSCFATSKNIWSNTQNFLLLQAFILPLPKVATSSLPKCKAKLLLRKA